MNGLYQISNLGNVKRLAYTRKISQQNGNIQSMTFKEKILKPVPHKNKYLTVTLSKNNKQKIFSVHRLVAEAFIKNIKNKPIVNHKDENKTNNNVDNLEWCDHSYNLNYGTRNERAGKSLGKKIICIETKMIYDSSMEVERQMKICHSSVISTCLRKAKISRWLSLEIYK